MISTVTNDAKRQFIARFLEKYPNQPKEVVWFLNYLLSPLGQLDRVHFTLDETGYQHTATIEVASTVAPFLYRKNKLVTTEVERAFHGLRLLEDEPLYIECRFPGREWDLAYAAVYEEDYALKCEEEQNYNRVISEEMLRSLERQQDEQRLLQLIDESLDDHDYERFVMLQKQYTRLKGDD